MEDWNAPAHARSLLPRDGRLELPPDAASLLITCVTGAKAPPASVSDISEKVKGRLNIIPSPASSNGSFPPPENQPNNMAIRFSFLPPFFAGTASPQYPPNAPGYTPDDPANSGGLKGRIAKPDLPIEQILALPAESPEEVYQGELDTKRTAFQLCQIRSHRHLPRRLLRRTPAQPRGEHAHHRRPPEN